MKRWLPPCILGTLVGALLALALPVFADLGVGTGFNCSSAMCFVPTGSTGVSMASASGHVSGGPTFTLGAGTGACATTSTLVGGSSAGSFLCTGTAGASTQIVNLPSVAGLHSWSCWANDDTSKVAWSTGATASTAITLSGTIATTSDKVVFGCLGY